MSSRREVSKEHESAQDGMLGQLAFKLAANVWSWSGPAGEQAPEWVIPSGASLVTNWTLGWGEPRSLLIQSTEPSLGLTATPAVFSALLDWRARGCAVGAIHATVTRLGLEHSVAIGALIEPLTGIRRHCLAFGEAALWAGQRGLQ